MLSKKGRGAGTDVSCAPASQRPGFPYGEALGEKIIGRGERVVIRRCQPSDHKAVFELNFKAMAKVPGYDKIQRPSEFDNDIRDIAGHYMIGRNDFIVAELGRRIIGCASMRERPDKGKGVVEFLRLRVDPAYFGNGIGEELTSVRYGLARKNGFSEAYMDVYAIQEASIKLHEKQGWELVETREPIWATEAGTKVFCYRIML